MTTDYDRISADDLTHQTQEQLDQTEGADHRTGKDRAQKSDVVCKTGFWQKNIKKAVTQDSRGTGRG